jgi:hypothetical protein
LKHCRRTNSWPDGRCALWGDPAPGAAAAGTKLAPFHAGWEVDDYVAEARSRLTNLAREQQPIAERAHLLFQSKLIALAVQAASVVVRTIAAHS